MQEYRHELIIAYEVAKASKDPSTQMGAILIQDGDIISMGFNKTMYETDGLREDKHRETLHAEMDAITKAIKKGRSLVGATLICGWAACAECAKIIASCGITTVVAHKQALDVLPERWKPSSKIARKIFEHNGVQYIVYDGNIGGITLKLDGKEFKP